MAGGRSAAGGDIPLILVTGGWGAALLVSGWHPFDRATWWMEVTPVLIALPVLWATRRRFPLTPLALGLIFFHGLVLMLGGAYSYARVPAGFAVQDWLGLTRNPYDRFGHLVQGFVPAIVLRELLMRAGGLQPGRLLTMLVIACCLAVSAAYELVEFTAAAMLGQGADEFLGTQGDPWDTQWDMLMCLTGAIAATLTLSRVHDRLLARDRRTDRENARATVA
jgi:putative membrane protein